jgi:hypothetical protein
VKRGRGGEERNGSRGRFKLSGVGLVGVGVCALAVTFEVGEREFFVWPGRCSQGASTRPATQLRITPFAYPYPWRVLRLARVVPEH